MAPTSYVRLPTITTTSTYTGNYGGSSSRFNGRDGINRAYSPMLGAWTSAKAFVAAVVEFATQMIYPGAGETTIINGQEVIAGGGPWGIVGNRVNMPGGQTGVINKSVDDYVVWIERTDGSLVTYSAAPVPGKPRAVVDASWVPIGDPTGIKNLGTWATAMSDWSVKAGKAKEWFERFGPK